MADDDPGRARPLDGVSLCLLLATAAGGVGRHVAEIVPAAVSAGARVRVAGPPDTDGRFGFSSAGAAFHAVPVGTRHRPDRALLALPAAWRAAAGADVVHAHGLRAGVLAALCRPAGSVGVLTWHNHVRAAGPPATLAARRADVSLCVSRDLVDAVFRRGGRPRLAPVGARARPATRPAAQVRAELGAGDRPLVVAVGRLARQKGFDVLLEAACGLPGVVVAVAGDGPERDRLARALRAGSSPRPGGAEVRLLGTRQDVGDLLAAADVVVMPSRWEGSPLAAHEALLAGRPLVATAVGGVPDLVGDAGVLVRAGDPRALVDAVRDLLRDPGRRRELGEAARRRAREWPDAAASAAAAVDVYRELLGRP